MSCQTFSVVSESLLMPLFLVIFSRRSFFRVATATRTTRTWSTSAATSPRSIRPPAWRSQPLAFASAWGASLTRQSFQAWLTSWSTWLVLSCVNMEQNFESLVQRTFEHFSLGLALMGLPCVRLKLERQGQSWQKVEQSNQQHLCASQMRKDGINLL